MAGAFMPRGVVGFNDFAENSMVRSPQLPSAPSYSYSSPVGSGSVAPYGGGGSVNAQIGAAGGAGNFQASDYRKLIEDAYNAQTQQALGSVNKSWGIDIGNAGYLPSDPKAKGLQAELIGAAMAPIMAQRSMALINAERANQDDRLEMAKLAASQNRANLSAIASGAIPGSITQHNGAAGSSTTYGPSGGGNSTRTPAAYNSEQEGYDRMMAMAAMMQAGGGGGGGQAQAPQGIPGLTPGVGGISSMIGSANPNTSGFGQKGPSAAQESILAQTRNTPPAPNYKPLPTGNAYSAFSNSGNGMSLAGGMGASLNSTISNMMPSATGGGGGAYTPSNTTKAAMAGAGLINNSPLLKPGGAPPGY